jgi:hypothetical protein
METLLSLVWGSTFLKTLKAEGAMTVCRCMVTALDGVNKTATGGISLMKPN